MSLGDYVQVFVWRMAVEYRFFGLPQNRYTSFILVKFIVVHPRRILVFIALSFYIVKRTNVGRIQSWQLILVQWFLLEAFNSIKFEHMFRLWTWNKSIPKGKSCSNHHFSGTMLVSRRVELYRVFDMQVAHVRDVSLCRFVWLMKGKMET